MGIKVNYYLYEHDVFPARRTASVSLTRNTFIDWFFASDRITYVLSMLYWAFHSIDRLSFVENSTVAIKICKRKRGNHVLTTK